MYRELSVMRPGSQGLAIDLNQLMQNMTRIVKNTYKGIEVSCFTKNLK